MTDSRPAESGYLMEQSALRILLIEDDEDDHFLVKELLSEVYSNHFHLLWAKTYEQGLAAICGTQIDACLLDYRLGERDGLELLRETTSADCDVPIILLTGQGDPEIDMRAMRAGASDYLVKAMLSKDLLERAIRYAIARKQTERALREALDELEARVQARTADLAAANRALQDSEQRYRLLVDSALDLIYTVSADGKVESLNPAFEQVTGWSAQDWIGRSAEPLIHPDDLPAERERMVRILAGEILPPVEVRILSRRGGFRTLEFKTVPRVRGGKIDALIGTARDVTERKRMEEALQRSRDELEARVRARTAELARANEALKINEKRLEALWELSQISGASEKEIADFVLDRQVRITGSQFGMFGFLNRDESFVTLHAWSRKALKECSFERTSWTLDNAGLWTEVITRRQPVIINNYEHIGLRIKGCPPGHVPLHRIMSVPVFDGERIVAVAMVANKDAPYDEQDVRQISLLLEGMWRIIERERAGKVLRSSENLAAMGRAIASVAHDIKTPLVSIGGFTNQVQKHLDPDSGDYLKLGIVLKETGRLEKMLREMLDFSRPLDIRKSPENVCGIIKDTLDVVLGEARKRKIVLQANLAQCERPVPVDAMRIKQAIINLVMNAIQASSEGNTVSVNMDRRKHDVVLDVIDFGCGIPEHERAEIFLPFFTTKKDGTGLGLPIVKKIVEAHNGHLELLDNPEAGQTFRVVLPLAA